MEAAGLVTLVLSVMPDVTASVGTPRIAAVSSNGARPFGQPGDADGQRAVLEAALSVFERLDEPGRIDLPFEGPPRRERGHPRETPPIARLLRQRPWLLPRFVSGNIPRSWVP